MKRLIGPLVLVTCSSLLTLLSAEAVLRLLPPTSLYALQARAPLLLRYGAAKLFVPDKNPLIRYRLRPNARVSLRNVVVTTNEMGFRGPRLREDGYRIVGIGDSVMFGSGVENDEVYLRRIESLLRSERPNLEVVNTAAPSYNTVQEVALLRRHLKRLAPRSVILGHVDNDFQRAATVGDPRGFIDRHSFLGRFVRVRLAGTWIHHLRGHDQMLDAIAQLGQDSRRHNFKVIAFLYGGWSANDRPGPIEQRAGTACRAQGFEVVTFREIVTAALASGEIENWTDLWLHPRAPVDAHPNAKGHRLIAEYLAKKFAKTS